MTQRDRLMVLGVLSVVALIAGWFLVLAPRRQEATKLADQVTEQRAAYDTALEDLTAGAGAARTYRRDYATVARLGTAVPNDDNVLSLLVQVQSAADGAKIDFRSLKLGQSSAAATPAPPPPAPTDPAAPATQAATATLPPGAAVGSAGFPTMPFSFEFDGDFSHLSDFVGRLERFLIVRNSKLAVRGRFMALDGISLRAAPKGFPRITANVAATAYLLPSGEGLTAGATAAGPAGSAAAIPTGPATVTATTP